MKKEKVLLVEDSLPIQTLVNSLIGNSCNLVTADTIDKAEHQLKMGGYSLVILDVMLPDGSGYHFCESLRKEDRFKALPIIFLTSKNEVEDKVHGFQLGADDYLVKPIEPKEFVARIESRLKRLSSTRNSNELNIGAFRINTIAQKAYLKPLAGSEKDLDLTPIEFKLLSNFMRKEGKVINRDEIKASVWGETVHVSSHTIDTHISSLRKKIEPCGKYIKSIVKRGYVFSLPIDDHPA